MQTYAFFSLSFSVSLCDCNVAVKYTTHNIMYTVHTCYQRCRMSYAAHVAAWQRTFVVGAVCRVHSLYSLRLNIYKCIVDAFMYLTILKVIARLTRVWHAQMRSRVHTTQNIANNNKNSPLCCRELLLPQHNHWTGSSRCAVSAGLTFYLCAWYTAYDIRHT